MSNTKIIITIIVIVIIAAIAYFAFTGTVAAPAPAGNTATTTETVDTAVTVTPEDTTASVAAPAAAAVITYTDAGFSPKTTTVKVGTTVRFVNNSSRGMWVASDQHPTHTHYDGTSLQQHCSAGVDTNGGFDECTAVNSGSVYSFTFPKAGTFTFHNHVQASDTGTVTVTQ